MTSSRKRTDCSKSEGSLHRCGPSPVSTGARVRPTAKSFGGQAAPFAGLEGVATTRPSPAVRPENPGVFRFPASGGGRSTLPLLLSERDQGRLDRRRLARHAIARNAEPLTVLLPADRCLATILHSTLGDECVLESKCLVPRGLATRRSGRAGRIGQRPDIFVAPSVCWRRSASRACSTTHISGAWAIRGPRRGSTRWPRGRERPRRWCRSPGRASSRRPTRSRPPRPADSWCRSAAIPKLVPTPRSSR